METQVLPTATPEEVGIPSEAVIQFIQTIEDAKVCLHSVLILRHGKLAAEAYWKPYHKDRKHRMYSCSKGFVSLAIGYLADEGALSLDDRVVDYFQDKLPREGAHRYIALTKIRDLLMMASPHNVNPYQVLGIDDWIQAFFHYPPSHLPGTVFFYNTAATHVLGALVERVAGMPFLEYLRAKLLNRIGFSEDAYCLKDPSGLHWGGAGMVCTPRDLAKLAMVCMRGGQHEGNQLIPAWYIREATSKQIDNGVCGGSGTTLDTTSGYGYQFWRLRNKAFAFMGMGMQLAVCVPDKDLVLVLTGDDQWQANENITALESLWQHLYPNLGDAPLPANPEGLKRLAALQESRSIMTAEGLHDSPAARSASGTVYQMDENRMGFSRIRFTFRHEGGIMEYEKSGTTGSLEFGYESNVEQRFPGYALDCVLSAAWVSPNTMTLWCYVIDEHIATMRFQVCFMDDTLTLYIKKRGEGLLDEYTGSVSGRAMGSISQ